MALPALNSRRGSRNSAPAPAHHPPRATSNLAPPISHTRHGGAGGVGGVSLGGVGMVGGARRGSTGNLLPEDHPTDDGGSTDNSGGGGESSVINEEDYIALQLEVARLREVRDEGVVALPRTFFQKRFFIILPLGRRSGVLLGECAPCRSGGEWTRV